MSHTKDRVLDKLIIPAPFGNYYRYPGVTSTRGTYTLECRAGWIKRICRILATVRYYPRLQAWSNKLGLPNPGILSLQNTIVSDDIISVWASSQRDWTFVIHAAKSYYPKALELNLSCPNVDPSSISEGVWAARFAIEETRYPSPMPIIAKLAPLRWMQWVRPLYEVGIRYFHLCNTIHTPGGGISGKPLKQYSLWAIEEVRAAPFGDQLTLIGGGGIDSEEDIREYKRAGADLFAVGSLVINPRNPINWGWRNKVKKLRDAALAA